MIEFLMPTDTKIFRERWPSRLVATAAEERLSFSAANNRPNKKSPSDAGAKLGFVCQGGSPRDDSDGNGHPLPSQRTRF